MVPQYRINPECRLLVPVSITRGGRAGSDRAVFVWGGLRLSRPSRRRPPGRLACQCKPAQLQAKRTRRGSQPGGMGLGAPTQWQYTRPGRAGQPPAKANYATFIDVICNITARLGASDALLLRRNYCARGSTMSAAPSVRGSGPATRAPAAPMSLDTRSSDVSLIDTEVQRRQLRHQCEARGQRRRSRFADAIGFEV
jgi:hypothetical protein